MAESVAWAERPFSTRELHPTFGLEIAGLDLSRPLDRGMVDMLARLSADHKVLVFKDQRLSSEQLNAFAANFGNTKQDPPRVPGTGKPDREHNVSRLGDQADPSQEHVPPTGYGLTARFWHTDSSWRPVPTFLTFLTAIELPDADGDTEFADMQAAYDALPAERKALLEGRHMVHSWRTLRRYEPTVPAMGDDEDVPPPATHPVVRTVNGRKGLFLNGHAAYYVGNMPFEDGEALFRELMAHATSSAFVYRHTWTIGDLVMWDDRTTMHRAMPYDTRQRRAMHRAEVIDTEAPR